jgi:hypothetical protein
VQRAVAGGVALTADVMQALEQGRELVEVLQAAYVLLADGGLRGGRGCRFHTGIMRASRARRNTERLYLRCANPVPNTIATQLVVAYGMTGGTP